MFCDARDWQAYRSYTPTMMPRYIMLDSLLGTTLLLSWPPVTWVRHLEKSRQTRWLSVAPWQIWINLEFSKTSESDCTCCYRKRALFFTLKFRMRWQDADRSERGRVGTHRPLSAATNVWSVSAEDETLWLIFYRVRRDKRLSQYCDCINCWKSLSIHRGSETGMCHEAWDWHHRNVSWIEIKL